MKNDIIFKILVDSRTKKKFYSSKVRFFNKGRIVECPKNLSTKIITALKKSKYKLVREMIDIYKDMFIKIM